MPFWRRFRPCATLLLAAACLLGSTACEGDPPRRFESQSGRIAIGFEPDGLVIDGFTVDSTPDSRRMIRSLRSAMLKIQRSGIIDEMDRELREARVLSDRSDPAPPGSMLRLHVTVEVMPDVPTLFSHIRADLPEDAAAAIEARFREEQRRGVDVAAVTHARQDGSVVVRFPAFTVLMADETELLTALLHELVHVEQRAHEIAGRRAVVAGESGGHGDEYIAKLDARTARFAAWYRTEG